MTDAIRTRDPYGISAVLGAPNIIGTPTLRSGSDAFGQPMTIAGMRPLRENPDYPDNPAVTTGLPGSPLNTMYGVDSESYLTSEQQKLARQIQGKFDASLDSRDRALQRYGAPMLSSYVEDEALARAMSLARGLNTPVEDTTAALNNPLRSKQVFPTTGRNTGPIAAPGTPSNSGKMNAESWARIMTGLASIAPLLFGKDAYGAFINKGLFPSIKEALFGKGAAASVSDEQMERVIKEYGNPYGANSGWGNDVLGGSNLTAPDAYGPDSGWGLDTVPSDVVTTPLPYELPVEGIPDFTDPWWG